MTSFFCLSSLTLLKAVLLMLAYPSSENFFSLCFHLTWLAIEFLFSNSMPHTVHGYNFTSGPLLPIIARWTRSEIKMVDLFGCRPRSPKQLQDSEIRGLPQSLGQVSSPLVTVTAPCCSSLPDRLPVHRFAAGLDFTWMEPTALHPSASGSICPGTSIRLREPH